MPREDGGAFVAEVEDPNYKAAVANQRKSPNRALELYLKVIHERERVSGGAGVAPLSHRGAGEIYLAMQNGIYAAYHFSEYKKLAANAAEKAAADAKIRQAQGLFVRNGIAPVAAQHNDDNVRIAERCRDLERANAELHVKIRALAAEMAKERKAHLIALSARNTTTTHKVPSEALEPAVAPPAPPQDRTAQPTRVVPTTYTVVEGDTLYKISFKVYGNGALYKKIVRANRDKFPSDNSKRLQRGWVLKIPPP